MQVLFIRLADEEAGSRILRWVKPIFEPLHEVAHATRDQVFALLRDDAIVQRLVRDMARAIRGVEDSITEAETLLAQFRSGLEEVRR
jgi:hypothetical protein